MSTRNSITHGYSVETAWLIENYSGLKKGMFYWYKLSINSVELEKDWCKGVEIKELNDTEKFASCTGPSFDIPSDMSRGCRSSDSAVFIPIELIICHLSAPQGHSGPTATRTDDQRIQFSKVDSLGDILNSTPS